MLDRAEEGDTPAVSDIRVAPITDAAGKNPDDFVVNYVSGIQAGSIHGNITIEGDWSGNSVTRARQIFIDSIRKRDDFMSTFLNQALRQADTSFNLSICFMMLGGLIVLAAAALAVSRFAGSPSRGIALVSGIGGILISTSGAAFSRRADKARKHLAEQAAMMQSQLLDEQRFTQIIDLLTGIRDPKLGDQARISLAMRLMDEINDSQEAHRRESPSDRSTVTARKRLSNKRSS